MKLDSDNYLTAAPVMSSYGPFSVISPDGGRLQFVPQINHVVSKNPNSKRRLIDEPDNFSVVWSAQLFVGLSVNGKPRWTADHIRDLAAQIRSEQLTAMAEAGLISHDTEHGLSVVPQYGFWSKIGTDGREQSVSITIVSLSGETKKEFFQNISELAGMLAVELEQDTVVYQLIHGGVVKYVAQRRTAA